MVGAWKDHHSGFAGSGCIYVDSTNIAAVDVCSPAVTDPIGAPGMTAVLGRPMVQLQEMQLVAKFLPFDTFAFLLASRTAGFLPGGKPGQPLPRWEHCAPESPWGNRLVECRVLEHRHEPVYPDRQG